MHKKSSIQQKPENKATAQNNDTLGSQLKLLGIGMVIGLILTFLLIAAGARLSEFSFLGLKINFATPAGESTVLPARTATTSHETYSPSALVSMSFRVNGWNPRVIDFRTTSEIGLPVSPGDALNFFDIWVNTPSGSISRGVLVEFYANDAFIGKTEDLSLGQGLAKLPEVIVEEKFADKNVGTNYWKVENSWKEIDVVQINYDQNGNKVAVSSFPIQLNPESTSWRILPPDVSLASFAYTINNGPETWIDIYNALADGINVRIGEKFKITQILYRAELAVPGKSLGIEASLLNTKDSYINNYDAVVLEPGTHVLTNFTKPFEWVIDEDTKTLFIRFARTDGTVVDYMEVAINK